MSHSRCRSLPLQVPEFQHSSTPLRLLATAGLRLLAQDRREAILEECRKIMAASGFEFRPAWASVITGDMEGMYAWVGANYITGVLQQEVRNLSCFGGGN